MSVKALKQLSAPEQAVVTLAVLLDGRDAADFLQCDQARPELSKVAEGLSGVALELRVPLLGSLYREALAVIERNGRSK
jgi:hypothetical protein